MLYKNAVFFTSFFFAKQKTLKRKMQKCILAVQKCILAVQKCILAVQKCILAVQKCILAVQKYIFASHFALQNVQYQMHFCKTNVFIS